MFGYVQPCNPQLRVCEYETYKAVYCGMCKQLGRQYGPFSRLTLNYDFTFLALLGMAVNNAPGEFSPGRCMLNPLKKHACCGDCEMLSLSAGAAMILFYYKVLDNYKDGGLGERLGSRLCMPVARHAFRQAAEQYPDLAQVVYEAISLQSQLEEARCDSVDKACEPTALAISGICAQLTQEPATQRILQRFGYLLGRYIYMADALDDLEQDLRQKSYNPFLLREGLTQADADALVKVRENAKSSLYLTVGELEKTYALLTLHCFQPILDNVIQLGLHDTIERILKPKETKRS